jgi:glycine cleavage system H protein
MSTYPANYWYTKEHEWVRVEGEMGTVGITFHAQKELGDIVYVDMMKVGSQAEMGRRIGEVQSVKAVSDIFSPVSGEVVEVNAALAEAPEILNQDPHGTGWLARIRMRAPEEIGQLMTAAEYQAYLGEES